MNSYENTVFLIRAKILFFYSKRFHTRFFCLCVIFSYNTVIIRRVRKIAKSDY